jgi:Protein of unknown function (DUF3016)
MGNPVSATWLVALASALSTLGCSVATERAAPTVPSRVSVTFVQPERFTDVKDSAFGSAAGAADLLGDLDRYLRAAGDRYVPPGLTLEIRITNVDLAGEFEPWRGPQVDRVRIMRDVYPPRIDLEFRLTDAQGAVVAEGRRVLRDPLYLTGAVRQDSDRLRYDTLLLGNWLRQEFGRAS